MTSVRTVQLAVNGAGVLLAQLGALYVSDPQQMSVIIPNFLNLQTNCVSGSKFFSVRYTDACGSPLAILENHIAAPKATADRIVEHVAAIPSGTVEAPRFLLPSRWPSG